MKEKIRFVFAVFFMLAVITQAAFAGGQRAGEFPTQPVTAIVPFAPGGGSDTLVRAVMAHLQLPNNQPMVAVNVPGAGGFIGAMQAFNANPNGYTIMTQNTLDLIGYYLAGQDTIPIFQQATTIALLVTDHSVISANRIAAEQFGWTSIQDVVAWAAANPGQTINWGMSGAAIGDNMINSTRIVQELGIYGNVNFVNYGDGASTITAALGNEIQIAFSTSSEITGVVASGDFVPLLVVNNERIAALPHVPSTLESGVPVTMTKPRGFFGPPNMNPAHVQILENALREVSENPAFRATIAQLGFVVDFVSGAESRRLAEEWLAEMRPFFE